MVVDPAVMRAADDDDVRFDEVAVAPCRARDDLMRVKLSRALDFGDECAGAAGESVADEDVGDDLTAGLALGFASRGVGAHSCNSRCPQSGNLRTAMRCRRLLTSASVCLLSGCGGSR